MQQQDLGQNMYVVDFLVEGNSKVVLTLGMLTELTLYTI